MKKYKTTNNDPKHIAKNNSQDSLSLHSNSQKDENSLVKKSKPKRPKSKLKS